METAARAKKPKIVISKADKGSFSFIGMNGMVRKNSGVKLGIKFLSAKSGGERREDGLWFIVEDLTRWAQCIAPVQA